MAAPDYDDKPVVLLTLNRDNVGAQLLSDSETRAVVQCLVGIFALGGLYVIRAARRFRLAESRDRQQRGQRRGRGGARF